MSKESRIKKAERERDTANKRVKELEIDVKFINNDNNRLRKNITRLGVILKDIKGLLNKELSI
jgi:hypothetical protein